MKHLFLLLVLLSSKEQCNQVGTLPFLSATSQTWVGGAAATRGTYYTIYLGMATGTDYTFDSLWVNNRRLPISIKRGSATSDTLVLFSNDVQGFRDPMSGRDLPAVTEAKFPIKVTAEGVLGYYHQGEHRYFPIPAFVILKPLTYE